MWLCCFIRFAGQKSEEVAGGIGVDTFVGEGLGGRVEVTAFLFIDFFEDLFIFVGGRSLLLHTGFL